MAYFLIKFTSIGNFWEMILHEIDNGINKGNLVQGSSERISMIFYLLGSNDRKLFGYGIGNYLWTSVGAFGFNHYGQSDLGTFLMLGGIAFIVLVLLSIYIWLGKVFKNTLIVIGLVITMVVSAIYAQLFTTSSIIVSVVLLLGAAFCAMKLRSEKINVELNSH